MPDRSSLLRTPCWHSRLACQLNAEEFGLAKGEGVYPGIELSYAHGKRCLSNQQFIPSMNEGN